MNQLNINIEITQEEMDRYESAKSTVLKALDSIDPFNVIGWMTAGMTYATALCNRLSVDAGWWDGKDPQNPETFATKIALVHSEISEAMEGGRKGLMDSHLPHRKAEEVELADALIRIFDLAGARGLDVAGAVLEKLEYNLRRADHKRDVRNAPGGKSF